MKSIKSIGIILFILLIAVNSSLLIQRRHDVKVGDISKTNINDRVHILEHLLCNNIFYNNNKKLSSNLICLDNKGKKHLLVKYLDEKPKLVLRISSKMCDKCINTELINLKKRNVDIKNDDIIILTSFSNYNSYKIFTDNHNKAFNILMIDSLNNSIIEKSNLPYYFILDNKLHPKFQFIPESNIPELSLKYLDGISFFLQNNNTVNKEKSDIDYYYDTYDFGIIKKKHTYTTKFSFVNNMNKPLLISEIKTSCGCTLAQFDNTPILPNSKSEIKINFTAEQIGLFQKQIIVFTNTNNKISKLMIKGEVID